MSPDVIDARRTETPMNSEVQCTMFFPNCQRHSLNKGLSSRTMLAVRCAHAGFLRSLSSSSKINSRLAQRQSCLRAQDLQNHIADSEKLTCYLSLRRGFEHQLDEALAPQTDISNPNSNWDTLALHASLHVSLPARLRKSAVKQQIFIASEFIIQLQGGSTVREDEIGAFEGLERKSGGKLLGRVRSRLLG